jgi:hypothetical protein
VVFLVDKDVFAKKKTWKSGNCQLFFGSHSDNPEETEFLFFQEGGTSES